MLKLGASGNQHDRGCSQAVGTGGQAQVVHCDAAGGPVVPGQNVVSIAVASLNIHRSIDDDNKRKAKGAVFCAYLREQLELKQIHILGVQEAFSHESGSLPAPRISESSVARPQDLSVEMWKYGFLSRSLGRAQTWTGRLLLTT